MEMNKLPILKSSKEMNLQLMSRDKRSLLQMVSKFAMKLDKRQRKLR